jgi:xanthine dehydrogenase YagT iron-sulfur-binding subunit
MPQPTPTRPAASPAVATTGKREAAPPLLAGRFARSEPAPPQPAAQPPAGMDRRLFLGMSLGALPAVRLAGAALREPEPGEPPVHAAAAAPLEPAVPATARSGRLVPVSLQLNGQPRELRVDPRTSLLDALREDLALDGTKKGCDHGQCGACTVLLDGRRVLSCLTLAAAASGHRVTTIEGLGEGDRLHPVQAAFLAHDAFQCGYCTPGQIVSAVGLLAEGCPQDAAAIRECMSGNICRCGAYPNIVAAIQQAQAGRTA